MKISRRPLKVGDGIRLSSDDAHPRVRVPWFWVLGGLTVLVTGIVIFWKRNAIVNITDKAKWAAYVFEAISDTFPQLSVSSRVIVVAHAAYESGWGSAYAAKNGNNLFNIPTCRGKPGCNDGWIGNVLYQPNADWEYLSRGITPASGSTEYQLDPNNGQWRKRIPQQWRKYGSYEDSVADYGKFLSLPNYARNGVWAALQSGSLSAFVNALSASRYFTLPAAQYLNDLGGVVSTVARFLSVTI